MTKPVIKQNGLPKTDKERLKRNQEKWTKTLMDTGFTLIPNVLIEYQDDLKLDPVDMNIVLYLAMRWWYRERLPRPSKKTLAKHLGINASTVRRHVAAMQERGLIHRIVRSSTANGRESNEYNLEGLIELAKPFAERMIEKRSTKPKRASKTSPPAARTSSGGK
jgi:hypothetical protein